MNKATEILIKVYTNTGELVAIPVKGYYQEGSYDITWDLNVSEGRQLANGLYFYTIEIEEVSVQDKLIIMN